MKYRTNAEDTDDKSAMLIIYIYWEQKDTLMIRSVV
jgi:hypothetical protein